MLRLVSFNLDYYWSKTTHTSTLEKKASSQTGLKERDRITLSAAPADYNFLNYFAYAFYAPLYLAGPIITFNDFMSQIRFPRNIGRDWFLKYTFRTFFCILTMEFMLHFFYVVAISKAKAWAGDSPFSLSMIAYLNLHIIWLKLLIPWRFFRMWSLADGIDPPENVIRCMSNNYSAFAFWRAWHRSYNRWIIRYIYIPLGGKDKPLVNLLAVFTFVALWHDISLRLLMWGWLVSLFVLPETLARLAFPPKKWEDRPIYRHLCAVGAVFNILMMMTANLVGFCVGLDGVTDLVRGMFQTTTGLVFFATSCVALFIGTQVMFEVREEEKRHGLDLRC